MTPINSLEYYIQKFKPSKTRITNIIKRSDAAGLTDINLSPNLHCILKTIQQQCFPRELVNNLTLIDCDIILEPYMTAIQKKENATELFENILVGKVIRDQQNKYNYIDSFLFEEIRNEMKQNKIIFIMFSFEDYDVDTEDKVLESIAHSTTAILLPKKKHYDVYYVNPHGRDIKETLFFRVPVSRKRARVYHYKEPLDVVFMKNLCNMFNNSEETFKPLNYDGSYRHTYYGVNLQSGDGYGLCFIFPFLLYYFVGKYLTRTRYVNNGEKNVYIASGEKLLSTGRLGYFIESLFVDFSKEFRSIICDDSIVYKTKRNRMERHVIKNAGNFLKAISSPMLTFMLQTKIKNIIEY